MGPIQKAAGRANRKDTESGTSFLFCFFEYRRTESVTAIRNEVRLNCIEKAMKVSRVNELYAVTNDLTKVNPELYIWPSSSRFKRMSNTKAISSYQYRSEVFKYSYFCSTIIA